MAKLNDIVKREYDDNKRGKLVVCYQYLPRLEKLCGCLALSVLFISSFYYYQVYAITLSIRSSANWIGDQ